MNKDAILDLLRSSTANHLSGAELARRLGVSRTAVWKHIKTLEDEGYRIEAVPSKGYRITAEPDCIRPGELKRLLGSSIFGRNIQYLTESASTNTLAMELASRGAEEGSLVIAEVQTGGKGRMGRSWVSPKGNLYFSAILRPAVSPHQAPLMTLVGAVAVARALRKVPGIAAAIKWPNDILIEGRKVSGLLTEMSAEADRIRHLVLGIGINCNMDPGTLPGEVRAQATSLATETGKNADRTAVLAEVLRELDRWYGVFLSDRQGVLDAWRDLNVTLDRAVTVSGAGELLQGTASDIDSEGRLVITAADGSTRTVAAGDVTIVKRP
ncbi:MAG: biotin--[acetyl-CoA-carboxylase] ligase [Nitrospirota bacterium]|nr:biotin--[acetyl-CoA-carboxylase] ligase [Nitrospirota bacterium]